MQPYRYLWQGGGAPPRHPMSGQRSPTDLANLCAPGRSPQCYRSESLWPATISRSADFQSAVSPNCIRPGALPVGSAADYKSAIQQNTILRYFGCGSAALCLCVQMSAIPCAVLHKDFQGIFRRSARQLDGGGGLFQWKAVGESRLRVEPRTPINSDESRVDRERAHSGCS